MSVNLVVRIHCQADLVERIQRLGAGSRRAHLHVSQHKEAPAENHDNSPAENRANAPHEFLGASLTAICVEHGRFYTFAGTTNGLRYDRPSKSLASGSAWHVSVSASKRRARPVRNAMFHRWHIRVLLRPSSLSAVGR